MAIERIKLTVKEVSEPKKVGEKGAQKLQFKATNPENKELSYFTFSTYLFEFIKAGATIDAEVDTTEREYDGNTYTDRKVKQIYENGQAVAGQRQGGAWGKPDNTASIEAQTAFKGIMELAARHETPNHISGKFAEAFELALDWAIDRLGGRQSAKGVPPEQSAKEKPSLFEEPHEPKSTGLNRIAGVDMDWLYRSLKILQARNQKEWTNAAVIARLNKVTGKPARTVTEAVLPLNPQQAIAFGDEVQAALEKKAVK